MRLYDIFIEQGRGVFDEYVSIDCTKIFEQVSGYSDKMFPFASSDYDVCLPPFTKSFVEYRYMVGPLQSGDALQVTCYKPHEEPKMAEMIDSSIGVKKETTWIVEAWGWGFVYRPHPHLAIADALAVMQLGPDGRLLDKADEIPMMNATLNGQNISSGFSPYGTVGAKITVQSVPSVLMTFRAFNRHAPIEQVSANRAQVRRAKRKGETVERPYYIVHIDPSKPRKVSEVAQPATAGSSRKAPDGVRGHTKFYPDLDGHRLFGKYSGIIHIPEKKGKRKARYSVNDQIGE